MGNKEESNRKWIYAQIDEPDHSSLLEICSETGTHVTLVVEKMIKDGIVCYAKNHKHTDSTVMINAASIEEKTRQNKLGQLRQLAYSHMADPTEESAEQLKRLCDMARVSLDTLLEDINKAPHLKEMVKGSDSLSRAELWLLELLEPEKPFSFQDIMAKAEKAGFKQHVINTAKQRINRRKDVQIESNHKVKQWWWTVHLIREDEEETF